MQYMRKVARPVLSVFVGLIVCDLARRFIPSDSILLWTLIGLIVGVIFTAIIATQNAWLCGAVVGLVDAVLYGWLISYMWSSTVTTRDCPLTWGNETLTIMLFEPLVGLVVAGAVSQVQLFLFRQQRDNRSQET